MSKLFSASTKIRSNENLLDLNGNWKFKPKSEDESFIKVPALWEAEGHLNLDGTVLYTRDFEVTKETYKDFSTIRFEGVMDEAIISINGKEVGRHSNPFTPFEINTSSLIKIGKNTLEVIVTDYPRESLDHIRSPHGKQGWANQEFPSPPSVYMTLGGIYRDVSIHFHSGLVFRNLSTNSDPDKTKFIFTVENVSDREIQGELKFNVFGQSKSEIISVNAHTRSQFSYEIDSIGQSIWSLEQPNLHMLEASISVNQKQVDQANLRFGLRKVDLCDGRLFVNGIEVFIKAALVQGFYPESIYAEPIDTLIRDEVSKAKQFGLNTLRLHIKAFDTRYLDICDELGIFVHCDIPIAEPISHDELNDNSEVGNNCESAVRSQVLRDYSHPSIILWSAMNELGLEKIEIRKSDGYKRFAIRMYETLFECDQTRPIIENDWIDPDPDYVFRSDILTSHWYGRIDCRYFEDLREKSFYWGRNQNFFYVSEFGDWGLPLALPNDVSSFWSYKKYYDECFNDIPWNESQDDFAFKSQKYLGISDKLQIEIFRSAKGLNGYCITELTDIPWELNGLLDYRRNIKFGALDYLQIANQPVLPILIFDYSMATRMVALEGQLVIHNTTDFNGDLEIKLKVNSIQKLLLSHRLQEFSRSKELKFSLDIDTTDEIAEITVELWHLDKLIGKNIYNIPTSQNDETDLKVQFLTQDGLDIAERIQVKECLDSNFFVVGENALDEESGKKLIKILDEGNNVLVLAQNLNTSKYLPVKVAAISSTTEWGGTDFHFTTNSGRVFSANSVLTTEDYKIRPDVIFERIGESNWPAHLEVGVFKPMPRARRGSILGSIEVGNGRLFFCQYRLNETCSSASTQEIARRIFKMVQNFNCD